MSPHMMLLINCSLFQTQCQDLRKRKNLELQILSEPVRGWEGESIKSLGQVVYMSQVHMQSSSNEVRTRVRELTLNLNSSYFHICVVTVLLVYTIYKCFSHAGTISQQTV